MKIVESKITTLLFSLTVIIIIFIVGVYFYKTHSVKATSELIEHTQEVMLKNNTILLNVVDIETYVRGYIVTDKKEYIEPYKKSEANIEENLQSLQLLSKDNSNQQIRIVRLRKKINEKLNLTKKIIDSHQFNSPNQKLNEINLNKGKSITDSIRIIVNSINNAEIATLKQQKIKNEKNTDNTDILLRLLFVFIIIISILVFFIVESYKIRSAEILQFNNLQNITSKYTLSLIEASRDPLFAISAEGKITDTNAATARITGVSKKELIGSDFINYFTDSQSAKECYEAIFSKGFITDYPLTIKDHKLTDVLFNGSVYKSEDEKIIGAVMVSRDITAQKCLEKELIEAKVFAENATIKAIEAVKSKQQFLSNMSHEIRTPMNAIIGFTKVVLKTELTSKQKEYLLAIKTSGDALIVLINDILDLAKVDAGKMKFEKIPFKLNLSIKAMLHLFETKILEKNLELITIYDPKIPEVLVGDPVRLHQVILNLLSNAIKFTNKGKITVTVHLVSENEENVIINFSIADTGIGIKDNKIENIFENFQQATSDTSRLFGGTGLGLAIVKQLIEGQNGTISVESELNKGSVFSFLLQFNKTTDEAVLEPEIIELNSDVKNIKILVVEDMELNQLLMKTLLDDFGFECEIAINGEKAIEKLQEKNFDIVLMDLQMPVMNGFEATEYIRNTMKNPVPIIALTADVTTADVAKCKKVGMNDYISKPVDERLLYSKLIGIIKKPVIIIEEKRDSDGVNKMMNLKYVDISYLLKLTKSNPEMMTEMINVYLRQTPPLVETMKQSYYDKDWKLLQATIHKIIPSFAIVGMIPETAMLAEKIQLCALNLERSEDLLNLIHQLEVMCKQSFVELEHELSKIKN